MSRNTRKEKAVLTMSVYAAIAFSITGIILGLTVRSQIILFDGLYSFISVALSFLSLAAAAFMAKNDWTRFPFGKDMVQPLVILIKYTVILLLVLGSLAAAVTALFQGGRDISLGPALVYAVISAAACFAVYRYLSRQWQKTGSELIAAESNQWFIDTMVSFGILGGFSLAAVFQTVTILRPFVTYIDPIMMVIVSLWMMKLLITGIKTALKEVLEMSPENGLRETVETHIRSVEKEYSLQESFIRISKTGQTLCIEVDFVADKHSAVRTIQQQDDVREKIARNVEGLPYKKWLTVSFTNDRKWAV